MKFEKRGTQFGLSGIIKGNHSYQMNITINEAPIKETIFLQDNTLVFSVPQETPVGKMKGIGITPEQRKAIIAEATAPIQKTEAEERARLVEIAKEAKTASDAVLIALAAERKGIMKRIGIKCEGCGKYFLPEEITYGVCQSCTITGEAW